MMSVAATAGKRLAGKVAIVTGGASGFGAAIVSRFAQEGAKIWVADMDVTHARPLATEMSGTIMVHEMNVTKKSDWDDLVKKVLSEHGKIDCLVNNAGTTHTNKVCFSLEALADTSGQWKLTLCISPR
jgi:NADP-dependent 3-hydroxy acid dehydrogenase YdfG